MTMYVYNIILVIHFAKVVLLLHVLIVIDRAQKEEFEGGGREAANLLCHTVTRWICNQVTGIIEKVLCNSAGVWP